VECAADDDAIRGPAADLNTHLMEAIEIGDVILGEPDRQCEKDAFEIVRCAARRDCVVSTAAASVRRRRRAARQSVWTRCSSSWFRSAEAPGLRAVPKRIGFA